MSSILVDAEKGVVSLIHELEHPPTDPATIPPSGLKAAAALGAELGLDVTKLAAPEVGWLFDLADHAVSALTAARETPPEPAAGQGAAETEVAAPGASGAPAGAETEVSAPGAEPTGGPSAATSPDIEHGAPEGAPADADAGAHSAHIDAAIEQASKEWGAGGGPPAS